MGCCILAALIIAQIVETWHRFRAYIGFPVPADDIVGPRRRTRRARMATWMRKPAVRVGLICALSVEAAVASTWVYTEHGDHLKQAVAQAQAFLTGTPLPQEELCTADGGARRMTAAN